MRRCAPALAFLLAALAAGEARAERLTVALSAPEVQIDSNFTGTNITVFGVIERDEASVSRADGYDVVAVVRGPLETVVARRKDRILGVWANRDSETIVAVPSFYSLGTSRPLAEVASAAALHQFRIGFDNLGFAYASRAVNDPTAIEFRDAFLRLKEESGLYTETIAGVSFIGGSVFRSTIRIPANVPIGRYTAAVYLFSGGALLATAEDVISITKTGFEQYTFTVAHKQALFYGLASVALALFAGWLAGVIFRRD
jgi:uncharacterized protein (TIGR02186 family)